MNWFSRSATMILVALVGLVATPAVQATPITYTLTGVTSFQTTTRIINNASFTWLGTGNTANLYTLFQAPAVPLDSISLTIEGLGILIPDTPFNLGLSGNTAYFVNDSGTQGVVFSSASLTGWNPTTPTGALTGQTLSGPFTSFNGGTVILRHNANNFATFTASVAPEPASLALFAMAALPVIGMVRRRKS